ncbi:MAG: hypothetical protein S4CHLAM123_03150 [Chlamydiales bacterium]|nr:hypothetical protein [Chlamydiales bacterium]
MKKIMTLLILGMICIPCLGAHFEEKKHFGYGSLGSIVSLPTVGGGYRAQYGYHGFDISGKCMPFDPPTLATEIRGLCLLYPKQKGFYLGSGFGYVWLLGSGTISFDSVVGYQWETAKGRQLFFQLEGIVLLEEKCCTLPVYPALTLGIGF